jgi:hypothetical protein
VFTAGAVLVRASTGGTHMTDRLVVVGEYIDHEEATLVAGALRAEGIRVVPGVS